MNHLSGDGTRPHRLQYDSGGDGGRGGPQGASTGREDAETWKNVLVYYVPVCSLRSHGFNSCPQKHLLKGRQDVFLLLLCRNNV